MTKKAFTVIVIPPGIRKVKKFIISSTSVKLFLILQFLMATTTGVFIYLFHDMRMEAVEADRLRVENRIQREELQALAKQVDRLSQQLSRLRVMDRKLRVIANLETGVKDEVEGIGGVAAFRSPLEPLKRSERERWIKDLKSRIQALEEAAQYQERSFEQLHEYLKNKQEMLACTPSIWPTRGWLTSGFGYRISPFTGLKEFHKGLDLAAPKGNPVIAPADGVVAEVNRDPAFGKYIKIRHGYGFLTFYGHLAEVCVKVGQKVKRGQLIGRVGNTGRSTGPHLHYEVHLHGIPVNPKRYILN